jgi:hypothetical protein
MATTFKRYIVLTIETVKLLHQLVPGPVKLRGKVVPVHFLTEHHAKKAYWGSGGIAPFIL